MKLRVENDKPDQFKGLNMRPSERRRLQPDDPDDILLEEAWEYADSERCDDPSCHCNSPSGRCDLCGAGIGEACICSLRRRATAAILAG